MTYKHTLSQYERVALVLQGGGALGSYQAGAVEGLLSAGVQLDWIAGISIGALNTAIIAGNPPEQRVAALKGFWNTICTANFSAGLTAPFTQWLHNANQLTRGVFSAFEATRTLFEGQKGFFSPRVPLPFMGARAPDEVSYYTTAALRETLLKYADFDLINTGNIRVSVGAVNVRTGNFVYFDNQDTTLTPEHFMASGALPPGFPAVKIDGEYYWDGGLVSNTPLSHIVDDLSSKDTLIFQVDLWKAQGALPNNFLDISERTKEIQYSSRTRMVTDVMRQRHQNRQMIRALLDRIPAKARDDVCKEAAALLADDARVNIIHLIYQDKQYEGHYKDYEFSPETMQEHWNSGLVDIEKTLACPSFFELPDSDEGFTTHDVHRISSS
ncbi:patatin-like phospholipase family protein [Hydromonas duriensis]|uniref:NTE family protein n=1 Tax=Hydromonas duriensis TaxID=1527608 RepID=A0A4R6Y6C2_9BURK|nr:patatin-like phospholipase family protein [Hydromonas duriensis]TDR30909.1 NTE family protein [Hydromonas duriensis]